MHLVRPETGRHTDATSEPLRVLPATRALVATPRHPRAGLRLCAAAGSLNPAADRSALDGPSPLLDRGDPGPPRRGSPWRPRRWRRSRGATMLAKEDEALRARVAARSSSGSTPQLPPSGTPG